MKNYLWLFLFIAAASSAFAQTNTVAYFGNTPFYVGRTPVPGFLDLNQDGETDVVLTDLENRTASNSLLSYTVKGTNSGTILESREHGLFTDCEQIFGLGTAQSFQLAAYNFRAVSGSPWTGPLGVAKDGYIGVRIPETDGFHFGWVHVQLPEEPSGPSVLYVRDWAYETVPEKILIAGEKPPFFETTFSGENEIPANHSLNFGNGTFRLENHAGQYILYYDLQFDPFFNPWEAAIYADTGSRSTYGELIADLGQYSISNIPPVILLPNGSPAVALPPEPGFLYYPAVVYSGQINLTDAEAASLLAGEFSINLESEKYRRGELRGILWPTAPIQFTTAFYTGSQYKGEAKFTLTGNNLTCKIVVGFAITSAAIYSLPTRQSQGELIPLTDGQTTLNLTDQQVDELKQGDYYVVVNPTSFRRSAIAEQIIVPHD